MVVVSNLRIRTDSWFNPLRFFWWNTYQILKNSSKILFSWICIAHLLLFFTHYQKEVSLLPPLSTLLGVVKTDLPFLGSVQCMAHSWQHINHQYPQQKSVGKDLGIKDARDNANQEWKPIEVNWEIQDTIVKDAISRYCISVMSTSVLYKENEKKRAASSKQNFKIQHKNFNTRVLFKNVLCKGT